MDPPLINESSFSTANPSAYSLAEIWPLSGGAGLDLAEESTLTHHRGGRKRPALSSEDDSSKIVSTTTSGNDLNASNGKRMKPLGAKDEHIGSKAEGEMSSVVSNKPAEKGLKSPEPSKQDYIHVRARRGQATDSHSLAERARREKISERMKILQDLVPGCNKVIGKALVLDEIINYIQSLQRQVEFLSMKLESVNSRMNMHPSVEGFPSKDLAMHSFDAAGLIYGSQALKEEYVQSSQPEWLHMQVGQNDRIV